MSRKMTAARKRALRKAQLVPESKHSGKEGRRG